MGVGNDGGFQFEEDEDAVPPPSWFRAIEALGEAVQRKFAGYPPPPPQ